MRGPLDPDTAQTFQVRFTPPAQAGDVAVKLIQTCEKGELDWIEVTKAGEPEPEHPAATLNITGGTPTAADETPEHDHDADRAVRPTTEVNDDSSSNTPLLVGIGAAVVVVGAGVALYLRSRGGGTPSTE